MDDTTAEKQAYPVTIEQTAGVARGNLPDAEPRSDAVIASLLRGLDDVLDSLHQEIGFHTDALAAVLAPEDPEEKASGLAMPAHGSAVASQISRSIERAHRAVERLVEVRARLEC